MMSEGEDQQEERTMQDAPVPTAEMHPTEQEEAEEALVDEIAGHFAGGQRAGQDYSMGGNTASESLRTHGRLVNLRRGRDGGYQILMRDRVIQGFCSQFEDITNWRMPRDTQIQARIVIQPTGRLRAAHYPEEVDPIGLEPEGFSTDRMEVRTRIMPDGVNAVATEGDGVELQSIAHPSNAMSWQVEALRHLSMERDQLTHTIDMIESLRRR